MANSSRNQLKQRRQAHVAADTSKPIDDGINAVGDNRRAGDVDGNQTGGDSKSPGAAEATDESETDEAAGKRR